MHLCEYNPNINHNDLTEDVEAKENILAAGELIWKKDKLKISNQSGHYEPEAEDVKNVTIDFFAQGIDIDFYYPFNSSDGSQTPLSSQSPNDAMSGYPDDRYKTTKKEVEKKSLKKKSKMKKIKRKTMKKKKSKKT